MNIIMNIHEDYLIDVLFPLFNFYCKITMQNRGQSNLELLKQLLIIICAANYGHYRLQLLLL